MAEAYQEGKTFSARIRQDGFDVYVSGHSSSRAASKAAGKELAKRQSAGKPKGLGPQKTTLAQAMQDYGLQRLPYLKGAAQEARRINKYLRAAGLSTLIVSPLSDAKKADVWFEVSLERPVGTRKIPRGLNGHRRNLLSKTSGSDKHRAALATTNMADVERHDVQGFMDALRLDDLSAASIGLERALLRALFNHANCVWNWAALVQNPTTKLKMPKVNNERDRVLSAEEQTRLDAVLQDCRNGMVPLVYTLLRETAMRSSEPLERARWRDVDWDAKILRLKTSKTGKREVPLSRAALQVLRDLQPGEPDERIVRISYEAMRAAWRRACERAGIEDLRLQDLRHTAATRMALKTGNVFLVKALTGHKTLKMVERYVNVKASDVVDVMHAPLAEAAAPAGPGPQTDPTEVTLTIGGTTVTLTPAQVQALSFQSRVAAGVPGVGASAQVQLAEGKQPAPLTSGKVIPLRRVA